MKRILSLVLSLCLVLGLCACGGKTETPAGEGLSWQEQYDLGIRYLSEGNYEEAIIAFTAAIEIDPKRPEAYIGLADVYTAQGDTDKALETLNKALELLGDNAAISAALEALSVSGSPETAPEIPAVLMLREGYGYDNGYGMVRYVDQDYLSLTQSSAAALQPLISAGLSGDPDTALAALQGVTLEQLRAGFGDLLYSDGRPALEEYDSGSGLSCWSVWNGNLIGVNVWFSSAQIIGACLEYRAAAGTGFSADYTVYDDGSSDFRYVHSDAMSGWLYNGAFTGVRWRWIDGTLDWTYQFSGAAADELLQGAYTNAVWGGTYFEELKIKSRVEHYVFEAGQMTDAWEDESGYPACVMTEVVYTEDDNVQIGYHGVSSQDDVYYVLSFIL